MKICVNKPLTLSLGGIESDELTCTHLVVNNGNDGNDTFEMEPLKDIGKSGKPFAKLVSPVKVAEQQLEGKDAQDQKRKWKKPHIEPKKLGCIPLPNDDLSVGKKSKPHKESVLSVGRKSKSDWESDDEDWPMPT